MTRFIAYYRVSTSGQGRSGLGLEAQRQAVHAFIGSAPGHEFTEVESGKRSDRPELLKALDLAELTGSALIVAKLDRLSRDVEFLSRLQKAPVKIIFADMPFADAFMIGIMAQVAQWEREQISKRTKAALQVAKERGRALGGDRGNLASQSAEACSISAARRSRTSHERARKVLPHVHQARAEGFRTYKAIAGYLNRRGITTSRGLRWSAAQVQRLSTVQVV
ncbi:MAG TPA: recombinase family protein [Allosphingosinicella sp.]|jgi:DNA invertase Pin-like site-specific DNA recombinase|uniref:recombinase family protein n=1 Tax=Allosphingosinicella sp. TaxID=2823234 RepID=UPI002F2943F3